MKMGTAYPDDLLCSGPDDVSQGCELEGLLQGCEVPIRSHGLPPPQPSGHAITRAATPTDHADSGGRSVEWRERR